MQNCKGILICNASRPTECIQPQLAGLTSQSHLNLPTHRDVMPLSLFLALSRSFAISNCDLKNSPAARIHFVYAIVCAVYALCTIRISTIRAREFLSPSLVSSRRNPLIAAMRPLALLCSALLCSALLCSALSVHFAAAAF